MLEEGAALAPEGRRMRIGACKKHLAELSVLLTAFLSVGGIIGGSYRINVILGKLREVVQAWYAQGAAADAEEASLCLGNPSGADFFSFFARNLTSYALSCGNAQDRDAYGTTITGRFAFLFPNETRVRGGLANATEILRLLMNYCPDLHPGPSCPTETLRMISLYNNGTSIPLRGLYKDLHGLQFDGFGALFHTLQSCFQGFFQELCHLSSDAWPEGYLHLHPPYSHYMLSKNEPGVPSLPEYTEYVLEIFLLLVCSIAIGGLCFVGVGTLQTWETEERVRALGNSERAGRSAQEGEDQRPLLSVDEEAEGEAEEPAGEGQRRQLRR